MEAANTIPVGSTAMLRKMARFFNKAEIESVLQLTNMIRHVTSVDSFLKTRAMPDAGMDALLRKPVLILTSDQERKQSSAQLMLHERKTLGMDSGFPGATSGSSG